MLGVNRGFYVAVSTSWGSFLWVSLEPEPSYLGSLLGPFDDGISHMGLYYGSCSRPTSGSVSV